MPDAPFGAVIEDELLCTSFPSEPNACSPFPGGVTDATLLGAGLIPAYFANTGEFRRSCVASCALMRSATVLTTDLERSERYAT